MGIENYIQEHEKKTQHANGTKEQWCNTNNLPLLDKWTDYTSSKCTQIGNQIECLCSDQFGAIKFKDRVSSNSVVHDGKERPSKKKGKRHFVRFCQNAEEVVTWIRLRRSNKNKCIRFRIDWRRQQQNMFAQVSHWWVHRNYRSLKIYSSKSQKEKYVCIVSLTDEFQHMFMEIIIHVAR